MIDLTPEEAQRVLAEGRMAHIAVISRGEPYVTPMSYVMVDGDLCFRTGEGRRVEALRESPRACIEVTILREADAWESVTLWGTARFVEEVSERSRVVQELLQKYHSENPFAMSSPSVVPGQLPIVAISPDVVTGRASGGGFTAKTRPGRL